MPIINRGDDHFQAGTYTGNGSTQTISGLSFQPDFVWIKNRSTGTDDHILTDSVRGANKPLKSNLTDAETTTAQGLTAFNSDGFTVGSAGAVNGSGSSYVYWAWKAGGTGVSNTDGSITSTVSANPTAGFSIVTYTGTGANATVGHGLGVAPSMIIVKQRDAVRDWIVYHVSLGAGYRVFLNTTEASGASTANFNNTAPTSSVFSIGGITSTNGSGGTYVAYCFAPVEGYSAFGSYTGNTSTDGPFVYTGFKPSFIILKRTDAAGYNWFTLDAERNTYNVLGEYLNPNTSSAAASASWLDFVSNGFKLRATASGINTGTIIYMAFAENPFKYSLAR